MATANTLAAVQNGARQVEVTINGLGERAGNTALEEVVMAIKYHSNLDFDLGIDIKQIISTSKLVSNLMRMPVQANKAIVGRNAFAHSSGIHQDGVLKSRETYEIIAPEDVGVDQSSIVLTACSGRAALKHHLSEIGYTPEGEEIERICRLGFEYAGKRRGKLTVVDKANVLATSRLWRETVKAMEKNYPNVEVEYMFVNNAAMKIIQQPKHFDVMVTENMFGDILTDEASVITGSLGLLPSASIGTGTSLFEPIHGSYPQAAGKNIANPIATILSAAMMFEYAFADMEAGAAIRKAVNLSIEQNVVTEDIAPEGVKPSTTTEVGDFIAKNI